jgi:hypothetical protein
MTQVTPEHHEHARARVIFTLHDSQHLPGEIPLTALAGIAAETQTLIRRLARSLDERSGPGRTPVAIENATELLLVAVRPGSTMLDVVGPAPSP